jgi:tetratricopeptide (TPR) repeat protein
MLTRPNLTLWRLFFLFTLVLAIGSVQTISAQLNAVDMKPLQDHHSSNPPSGKLNRDSRKDSSRNTKNPSTLSKPAVEPVLSEKERAIKNAIDEGNEARDKNEYKRAVDSYERVINLDKKDWRAHYGLGNVYSDLSCNDSAIGEYRDALRLKKDSHEALIALGYAYANKERYDEAEQEFREVFSTIPNDPEAKIGQAFISVKRKKYDDAINDLKLITNNQAIETENRATAYLVLGDIYYEQKKWAQAADEYQQAISLNPALNRAYLNLGMAELVPALWQFAGLDVRELRTEDRERLNKAARQATERFRDAINGNKFDHPLGYLYLATGLLWQFNFRESERNLNYYLDKVKELDNQLSSIAKTKTCDYGFASLYAKGYSALAALYEEEGFLADDNQKKIELRDKAIESLKRAIQLKEDDAGSDSSLGRLYDDQGRYAEAIEQYEKAISHQIKDDLSKALAYGGIAHVYSESGRVADAIEWLNKAIKLQPEVPIFYTSLAMIYQQQGNFDEAISNLKKAIDRERPPTAHSSTQLGTIYFVRARQKGNEADYEEAIKLANDAIKINRSYGSAYLLLGQVYKFYRNGADADKAIENYELAAKYDPKNPLIYFSAGNLYFAVKHNDDAAVNNLKKAVDLKPDYAQAYLELGEAYHHKHDDAEAIKQLQNAIKYDDNNVEAYRELINIYDQQKNYDDAIKWLLMAAQKFPTDYFFCKELARMYSETGKNEEAIRYYQEASNRLKTEEAWLRDVYTCRIETLRGHYAEAITCAQRIKPPSSTVPGQIEYEIGLTYVASQNKKAALAQYDKLKQMKSLLADYLLRRINEMK